MSLAVLVQIDNSIQKVGLAKSKKMILAKKMPGHPTSDAMGEQAELVELGQMRRRGGGEVR